MRDCERERKGRKRKRETDFFTLACNKFKNRKKETKRKTIQALREMKKSKPHIEWWVKGDGGGTREGRK